MEKTRAAAKATADCVCSNPWKALGIAAAVGFVLCLLATRFGHPVISRFLFFTYRLPLFFNWW